MAIRATRRRSRYFRLGAFRRGYLPVTSKRSTWGDVEEWRLITTVEEFRLHSLGTDVNLSVDVSHTD